MPKDRPLKGGKMKCLKICSVFFLSGFMLNCVSSTGPITYKETAGVQSVKVGAAKFEEVELTTLKGDLYRGKIVSLVGGRIEFRPFPYWNVELISLNLGEIRSIDLVDKPKRAGKAFLQGFGWTYSIVGGIAAISSKYDEDYQMALVGSAIVGAAGGLVGLLVGAVQDSRTKTNFEFVGMSDEERERSVRMIMGLTAQR
jgi:hypothetical protein